MSVAQKLTSRIQAMSDKSLLTTSRGNSIEHKLYSLSKRFQSFYLFLVTPSMYARPHVKVMPSTPKVGALTVRHLSVLAMFSRGAGKNGNHGGALDVTKREAILQHIMNNVSSSWREFGELLCNSGNNFGRIDCFRDVTRDKELSCNRCLLGFPHEYQSKDDENGSQRLLANAEVIKRHADLGWDGMEFAGNIKSLKAPQLKDLAWSLGLEESGTREMCLMVVITLKEAKYRVRTEDEFVDAGKKKRAEFRTELEKDHLAKTHGTRTTNAAAAADAQYTIKRIALEMVGLAERTGMIGFAMLARGHLPDKTVPVEIESCLQEGFAGYWGAV
ncbi:hypothetical protein B0H14DRAFT_2583304 [Mycena olivaceomarginata]|nr:hypothetical protein B0H14DRAFT_2583304 [Mycena olivaceomarginata]